MGEDIACSLRSVNLSLSNLCGADCIFCPKSPKKQLPNSPQIMPLQTAKKIADEIAVREPATKHVTKLEVGENGDGLLNPNFLEILRYFKLKNPKLFIHIYTNFQNFKPDISDAIVKEHLLDGIVANVDGYDTQSYYEMKKLNLTNTMQNVGAFLEARKRYNSKIPLNIKTITYTQYASKLHVRYRLLPQKIEKKDIIEQAKQSDDFKLINRQLRKILNPKLDSHFRSVIIFWAEREQIMARPKVALNSLVCPKIKEIGFQAYIAPNGDWYACCNNEIQNVTFGNVNQETLNQIFHSKQRQTFLDLLSKRHFSKIGYPCNMVEACQIVPLSFKERIENYYNHVTFRLSGFVSS